MAKESDCESVKYEFESHTSPLNDIKEQLELDLGIDKLPPLEWFVDEHEFVGLVQW